MKVFTPGLEDLLAAQDQVVAVASALRYMSTNALRWSLGSGRWQRPCRGVIVAHSGPITDRQRLWIATIWAGGDVALGGLSAATLEGLQGFAGPYRGEDPPVHLVVPAGRSIRKDRPAFPVAVHYSRLLGLDAVHPARQPRRTRIARSIIDAASWMATDRGAQAVLAAGVQQGLTSVAELSAVTTANSRLRRHKLIGTTLADISGGARALSELDFTRLVIRAYRLPEPDRQRRRKDSTGKNRYLDAYWERARLVVEIDGAQHLDPEHYWDDMSRDNDLIVDGYRVLRFPAWLVRYQPALVAAKIREALRRDRRRPESWPFASL